MSLLQTLSQGFRASAPEYSRFEYRITEAGCFSAFQRQTTSPMSWISPDLADKFRRSAGRTVDVPVIDYQDVTIRATRPVTIPIDENDSALVTLTPVTLAYGFHMYETLFQNNDITLQQDFNAKMMKMLVKMTSTLDGLAETALNNGKTQVLNYTPAGTFAFTANVLSETAADIKNSYAIGQMDPVMRGNDFGPFNMDIIGNPGVNSLMNYIDGFGKYNQEQKTLQYQGKNFHFSNSIANALNKIATGYAVKDGTLGILTRVEPDSLLKSKTDDGHEWGTMIMPGLGLEFGTYMYNGVVDASTTHGAASAHLTRTPVKVFDFAIDVLFAVAYNSDAATLPSPIVKFDVALA